MEPIRETSSICSFGHLAMVARISSKADKTISQPSAWKVRVAEISNVHLAIMVAVGQELHCPKPSLCFNGRMCSLFASRALSFGSKGCYSNNGDT